MSIEIINDNSMIALDQLHVFNEFTKKFPIQGKRVLEIGGAIPWEVISELEPISWVSIDPRNKEEEKKHNKSTYKTCSSYAQMIPFQDNTFDYIFSCNAFHHISRLNEALDEMLRVLKIDGFMFSHFGPIWSGPDGAHIEDLYVSNDVINFWEVKHVPDWAHLVLSPSEMYELLSSKYSKNLSYKLVEYIYFSNWINRMTLNDYLESFIREDTQIIGLYGGTSFGYEYEEPIFEERFTNSISNKIPLLDYDDGHLNVRDIKIVIRKLNTL